jgi:hypothetical protein
MTRYSPEAYIKGQPVKRSLLRLSIFVFVALIYYKSPVHYLSDGSYSLLMDEAILHHSTPDLSSYHIPRGHGIAFKTSGYLWTADMIRGRLLYLYPWGGPLLSLPFVAILNEVGLHITSHENYVESNELRMQVLLATLLSAGAVWIIFETGCVVLPQGWSATIALSGAFGTQMWSTLSRSLWPQTWYLLLVSAAIWLLMKEPARPIRLATLLAWAAFTRPQGTAIAVMVAGYLFLEYGCLCFVEYSAVGAAWAVCFASVTLFFFGTVSSPAYQGGLDFPRELIGRIEGILISPSRGLLVFVPILLLPVYLTLRYWGMLPRRRLVLLALAIIVTHIVITASWPCWWGGGSYGPRLLSEALPWFVLLAVLGVRAFIDDQRLTMSGRWKIIWISVLLLIISMGMNAVGAVSWSGLAWNKELSDCRTNPRQIWEWKNPQFMAWVKGG